MVASSWEEFIYLKNTKKDDGVLIKYSDNEMRVSLDYPISYIYMKIESDHNNLVKKIELKEDDIIEVITWSRYIKLVVATYEEVIVEGEEDGEDETRNLNNPTNPLEKKKVKKCSEEMPFHLIGGYKCHGIDDFILNMEKPCEYHNKLFRILYVENRAEILIWGNKIPPRDILYAFKIDERMVETIDINEIHYFNLESLEINSGDTVCIIIDFSR